MRGTTTTVANVCAVRQLMNSHQLNALIKTAASAEYQRIASVFTNKYECTKDQEL